MSNSILPQPSDQNKPVALSVLFENIPHALAQRPRWLLWRYEYDAEKGKWKKPPYSVHSGRKCDEGQPANWGTFEQVRAAYQGQGGRWDGIGIALGDDLAGLDLDKCLDEQGQLSTQAGQLVGLLDTYTEISPSGEGIKALAFGAYPCGNRRERGIELYSSARYFTITGHVLHNSPRQVHERGQALAQVERLAFPVSGNNYQIERKAERATTTTTTTTPAAGDDWLIQKAMSSQAGPEIARLWAGNTSDFGDDHSLADFYLCKHLAFWTGKDAGEIDRLFRQSGLMRPKWDEVHRPTDRATYGEMTIDAAITATKTTYQGQRPAASAQIESTFQGDDPILDVLQEVVREREALRQELERRDARDVERDARDEALRRVVRSPMKDANLDTAKILMVNLLLDAEPVTGEPEILGRHYRQMALQVEYDDLPSLAARYGMTESSLKRYLLRLDMAHVCARKYDKNYSYPNGEPAPYPVTEATTLFLPSFDDMALPYDLPTTKQMDSQRSRAADTRSWAKTGKKLYCPECHERGLEGRCTHCGHVIKADDEGQTGEKIESTPSQSVLRVESTYDDCTEHTGGGGNW